MAAAFFLVAAPQARGPLPVPFALPQSPEICATLQRVRGQSAQGAHGRDMLEFSVHARRPRVGVVVGAGFHEGGIARPDFTDGGSESMPVIILSEAEEEDCCAQQKASGSGDRVGIADGFRPGHVDEKCRPDRKHDYGGCEGCAS